MEQWKNQTDPTASMAPMGSVIGTTAAMNETSVNCSVIQGPEIHVSTVLMIMEMIVGLPGNILALFIFCFHIRSWKPHTLFLFNLVLADFLLLISVPFRIDADLREESWVLGQAWCQITLFMLAVNRSASIAFMTAVALDRYFKVVHPHHCISRVTVKQAGLLAGFVWVLVIALRIPLLTIKLLRQNDGVSRCRSFNSYNVVPLAIQVHYAAFITESILPWFLLVFCSARIACHLRQQWMDRQKKRARKVIPAVLVINVVFTICFMPSLLTGMIAMFIKHFYPKDCTLYSLFSRGFVFCLDFTYLSSALDPLIYCFSSVIIRDALKQFIRHLGKEEISQNTINTS